MGKTSDRGRSVFDVPPQTTQSDQSKYDKAYMATGAKKRRAESPNKMTYWGMSRKDSIMIDDELIKNRDYPPPGQPYKVGDKDGKVHVFRDGGHSGREMTRERLDKWAPVIQGYENAGREVPPGVIPPTPENSTRWGGLGDSLAQETEWRMEGRSPEWKAQERKRLDRENKGGQKK